MASENKSEFKCLNCTSVIDSKDKFCSVCGQQNRDLKISFWELVTEFLASNFNFDTKLGRTLVDLLAKPGEITRQFNLGKRVRYVKPIQMYLFVSFIYFLLVGLDPPSFVNTTPPSEEGIAAFNETGIAQVNIEGSQLDSLLQVFKTTDPENDAEIDSMLTAFGEEDISPWNRHLAKQAIRTLNKDNEEALTKEIYANLSIAMLLLLPVFAILLWMFTKKQSPYYIDSVVFSIHFHSVVLLIFSLNMMAAMLFDEELVFKTALLSILIYLILALRRVYQTSWLNSVGKALGLALSYSIIFGISYFSVLVLSFWIY